MTTETQIAARIPVTVLTGYLGAGKTTLLNRILSEQHGKKYAVIINEFGEVGIDNDLVIDADEEIFEMNNGCICCTVRGDLIRIIGNLLKRGRAFDGIIVETTGLADPGPVIQSFFVDDALQKRTQLDAIITLVDAANFMGALGQGHEAAEQVAFADIVLLNKTDAVSEDELAKVTAKVRHLNPLCKIIQTQRSAVPLTEILGVQAFELERIMQLEPDFLTHGHHHDHNDEISSVCLTTDQPLNPMLFNAWINDVTQRDGPNLLRYKGILRMQGSDRRYVLQGVHMMLEGTITEPWRAGENQNSRLVFIGKKLDAAALQAGFDACTLQVAA